MSRKKFGQEFQDRLIGQLRLSSYASKKRNSAYGVQVAKIAKDLCCSTDIVRRYLNGSVSPEYHTVFVLAKMLNVAPGWLLFGEQASITGEIDGCKYITIKEDLLCYIIESSAHLFSMEGCQPGYISEFILFLLRIVNKTNCDAATKKILVDAAVKSADVMKKIEISCREKA